MNASSAITYSIALYKLSLQALNEVTVELGYLAHAPNETTAAAYAPNNETHSLASSILLTPPPIMKLFDFTLN